METFSNELTGTEFTSAVDNATARIIRVLEKHCGPYATNAIIPAQFADSKTTVDRFTKDGITIASSLSVENMAERFTVRQVCYVGSKVDAACHDGTTTSMLFMAHLLKRTNALLQTRQYSRLHIAQAVRAMCAHMRTFIKNVTFTVDDLAKVLIDAGMDESAAFRAPLYCTALISSKGDAELAKTAARVATAIPPELRGMALFEKDRIENDDRFRVDTPDYQFRLPSVWWDPKYNNKSLGGSLDMASVDIYATPNTLGGDSIEAKTLMSIIGSRAHAREDYGNQVSLEEGTTRPLVIIAAGFDHLVDTICDEFTTNHPDRPIIKMQISALNNTTGMWIHSLKAMAGVDRVEDVIHSNMWSAIIRDVKISGMAGDALDISNLYEKTTQRFHPFYYDMDAHPYYKEMYTGLKELMESTKNAHSVTAITAARSNTARLILRMMISQDLTTMRIGGKTTDNVEATHVVEDVLGSLQAVLSDGFVTSGYFKMLQAPKQFNPDDDTPAFDAIMDIFHKAIYSVLTASLHDSSVDLDSSDVMDLVRSWGIRSGNIVYDPMTQVVATPYKATRHSVEKISNSNLMDDANIAALKDPEHMGTLLLQPAVGFLEQIDRIEEILPRFVMSNCMIDIGAEDNR